MSKWIVSLVAVALSAVMFSGCGGSEGSSSAEGGNNGGGSTNPPPTEQVTKDFTGTPDQFGNKLPAVPVMPDMAE